MSKERLEELAYNVEISLDGNKTLMSNDDYDFLYKYALQQAERVQELELEVNDWRAEVQKWQKFYKESEESHLETKELLHSTIIDIKRYKQVLELIYKDTFYESEHDLVSPLHVIRKRAEKVLEGEEWKTDL